MYIMNNNKENYMQMMSSPSPSSADSSPKKARKIYNDRETEQLEAVFQINHFPGRDYRLQLAKEMGVSPKNVQVWFQNRRAREKNLRHKAAGYVENPIERMRHQWTCSTRMPFNPLLNRLNVPAPAPLSTFASQGDEGDSSSSSSSSFTSLPDVEHDAQPAHFFNVEQPVQSITINEFVGAANETGRAFNEPVQSIHEIVLALNEPLTRCRSPLNSTSNVSEISNSSFMELLKSVDEDLLADCKIPSNEASGSEFINFLSPSSDRIFEF